MVTIFRFGCTGSGISRVANSRLRHVHCSVRTRNVVHLSIARDPLSRYTDCIGGPKAVFTYLLSYLKQVELVIVRGYFSPSRLSMKHHYTSKWCIFYGALHCSEGKVVLGNILAAF